MKKFSILPHLNELLIERARVEVPQNNDYYKLRYLMNDYDPKSPNAKENAEYILKFIYKLIARESAKYAGNTWNGYNITKDFIKQGKRLGNPQIKEGDPETYTDTLWYKADFVPTSRVGAIKIDGTYLNEDGKIDPNHIDIINHINEKYGLNIDPNEKIIVKGESKRDNGALSNNTQQFLIWRDKYFLPWFANKSATGSVLLYDYNLMLKGELTPDTSRASKSRTEVEPEITKQEPEETYDNSVIDSIVKDFKQNQVRALGELYSMAFKNIDPKITPQQIYNTYLLLYPKIDRDYMKSNTYDHIFDYKRQHPELKGKFESVEEANDTSWLNRNGDYSIFDKLNDIFRLKKESKENTMTDNRKILHEDNVFSSINTNENDFDPSKVSSDVFNDDNEEGAISEKDELKKNKLTKEVLNKINDTLKLNKEVQDILDEIRNINNKNDYNIWVVNEEGNTATLASKNAKIFKQNLNLCLSHDNKIEIFKSVQELHDWLKEHRYPLPKNIQLHESVSVKESDNNFSGLRNWLNNIKNESSELEEDCCCGGMGDTTSASLGTALQYIYKNKKKTESLGKETFLDKLKSLKEDDTDVASNFDSAIQSNAGFGSDTSSTTNATSSDLNSEMNSNQDDTVDLGQDSGSSDAPAGFGDLNINTSGYGPDEGNPEEMDDFTTVPEDEYQIVDVLTDSADNIRVKVKNLTTGKIEYKDLSEIDI